MLETGIKGHKELTVTMEKTAKALGSGGLEVFATPALIAMAERTARESVAPELGEGQSTVGIRVEISHLSATPVGLEVFCDTELVEIDRRRLVFRVEVHDKFGKIAEGMHERFIIDDEKFLAKAYEKVGGKS
ncbi:MAG: thioesterase family protein [Lachnospiraceae bacterium]|nr:thioesterase family protein [Lachnospiraceae bacterium]MBQ7507115.1 thioesterase family protein [Lachnospiraceae bacterium]